MEEWKEYKIGDLCNISSSKRIFAKEYQEYGVPFFRGKEIIEKQKGANVSNELFISEERYAEIKNKYGVPQRGDMLLTSVGTLGVPYIVKDEKFYFKDGNLTWFYNFNGLNSKYLYYWFLSPTGKYSVDSKAIGSTQKALTIDCLSKFDIRLPSINTQERIVSILSSLDDKIEVNRRINEQLEELAQALFKSWFVDFEPFKDGEFVESELGMIPEGWKVCELSDVLYISKDSINPSKTPDNLFHHYSIPAYDNNKREEAQEGKAIMSNKFKVTNKTTLFSKLNPRIKRVWFIDNIKENAICSTEFVPYKAKNNELTYFVYGLINSDFFYKQAMSIVNGATGSHQRFHPQDTLKFNIAFNESVAKEYSSIVEPIVSKILVNQQEISHLTNLRDTLLPKLMSGEIDVNEVEI